jgi:hypothetical protein
MPHMSALEAVLAANRNEVFRNEADVKRRLIEPCLRSLGWVLTRANTEVWLPLTGPMAQLWNYSSGRMRRDYVLRTGSDPPVHIEAKHRWPRFSLDMEILLSRINRDDWNDTTKDGPKKDLALVLWGARSQGGRCAAIMDESLLLVFDWDGHWVLTEERQIFADPREDVIRAFALVAPSEPRT